jgi:hypothetical protein
VFEGPDNAGIPDYFIARADDEFFAGIGRVCALASCLDEDMLPLLLSSLSDDPQDGDVSADGAELIKRCKAAAKANASPEVCEDVNRLMRTAVDLRGNRNALVHSVWTHVGRGRRRDPKAHAGSGRSRILYETDKDSIQKLITDFVMLLHQIDHLQQDGNAERHGWPPLRPYLPRRSPNDPPHPSSSLFEDALRFRPSEA